MIRRALALLFAALLLSSAMPAFAGGFAAARFGGEHGNPMAGNAASIYYNPAGLALQSGHRIMVDGSLALLSRSYERVASDLAPQPPSDLEVAGNTGKNELSQFLISPFIGFATDFGTGAPFGVGVGFYAPFGGQSAWDQVDPVDNAPGAVDGPQRWYIIEGEITTLAVSLGAAYRIEPANISIGLGFNTYLSTVNTIRARNSDGTDDLVTPGGDLKEGRSWADVSSVDFGVGIGVIWEAIDDAMWIGASYQSQPNFGADMELTGTLTNVLLTGPRVDNDLTLTQELPDVLRFGIRYRPMWNLELRLFGDWQRWSVFEQQCLVNTDVSSDVEAVCSFNSDGTPTAGNPAPGAVIQNLQRQWENTFGVRIGASYWINEDVELIAGFGYDSSAVPDAFIEPALPDFDKVIPVLGTRIRFTPWFSGMLTLLDVIYFERDTTGVATAEQFQPPNRQPTSAGIYTSNVFVANINLEFTFGGSSDDEMWPITGDEELLIEDEVDEMDESMGDDVSFDEMTVPDLSATLGR